MSTLETVQAIVEPLVAEADAELVDVEHNGSVLRVTVDRPDGVGVGLLQRLSREIGRQLDEQDPIAGRYTLEVSSPGLERPLKKLHQFQRAQGEKVTIKTKPGVEGARRVTGTLVVVDEGGVEMDLDDSSRRIAYDEIASARTVFEWGPTPKPGGSAKKRKKQQAKRSQGPSADAPASDHEVSSS